MVSDFGLRDSSDCCKNWRHNSDRRLSCEEVRFIRSIRGRQARASERIHDVLMCRPKEASPCVLSTWLSIEKYARKRKGPSLTLT